ncbi:endo-1,4-beta-xylanase [Pedobacter fastidiosus]|uniref:Beta-xylanase n=1 Tax=Pedobacter fastidiosus TaxID=2765361 RepID=A0ABR7KVS9_9SPHI|nr:endo-1,4-beta-xylanase [Pedobacter fastidiosus]MBC6111862.1 endo-1,4-beta-xylanase [Pedobacter fastidiosus]
MSKFLVFSLVIFVVFSCKKKIKENVTGVKPTTEKTLKDMPFPFGAAVSASLLRENSSYKAIVIKEYSSLTPENAMKFGIIHPAENYYNWPDADEIVALAIADGKRIHGHTLNWYADVPVWVKNFKGSAQDWENLLKTHIQTIVSHFKGKVASWDVVNEAFEDDGSLRNSIWVQKLGADYIARAFQYAHEADPAAILFYNDYGNEYGAEYTSKKREAILNLVNSLKNRGIPIGGIGLQMHTRYIQTDANISLAITSATATGLKVHISELDVALNATYDPALVYTESLGEMQAAKYKSIVKIYYSIPKSQQWGITTWNVTDGDSWVPGFFNVPDWPLIFDKQYQKKPAYQAIFDGVVK